MHLNRFHIVIVSHITRALWHFNSFLDSGDFCHLLITFANSLDPGQDGQNVGPDVDPNHSVPERFFLKQLILKKSDDDNKSTKACKE